MGIGVGRGGARGLWVRVASAGFSAPVLDAVSPNPVTADVTNAVTLLGTFPETPSSVTVGGTAATSIVKTDLNHVTCTAPAKAAASYDVVVTAAAGSDTLTGGLTYGGGGGGGAAPQFGDNVNDVLIFNEIYNYASTAAMKAVWVDKGGQGANVTLDINGGPGGVGTNAAKYVKAAGTVGPHSVRTISGAPTHFFLRYQFKLTAGNGNFNAKWLICENDGASVNRYQWATTVTTNEYVGIGNIQPGRMSSYPVHEGQDGPLTSGEGIGYYLVPGQTWNPNEPVPFKSDDVDINLTPWGPLNDDAWHTIVIEIQTGTQGNAFEKRWLDDELFWDSTGTTQGFPGRPTTVEFAFVSGTPSIAFTTWRANVVAWRR